MRAGLIALLSFIGSTSWATQAMAVAVSNAIVKIRSYDPVLGTSAVASGFAFRHLDRGIIITSEHAVLNSVNGEQWLGFEPHIQLAANYHSDTRSAPPTSVIDRNFRSSADPIRYEIRFSNGTVTSATSIVSDWGKGVTLLSFMPPSNVPLDQWQTLRLQMTVAPPGPIRLGGYPARSSQLQEQIGTVSHRSAISPPIAELDEMTAIQDSFAEYGMSGGAAWNDQGAYLGMVSHVTNDGNVLLIPGDRIREWVDSLINTGNIRTQLFKDAGVNFDIYYSRSASFTLNCLTSPCQMQFDVNERKTPSTTLPSDAQGTIVLGLDRLRAEELRRRQPDEPYIAYAVVRGFRKRALRLIDIGRTPKTTFDEGSRFFQLLRATSLIPIVQWQWNTVLEVDQRIERLVQESKALNRDFARTIAGSRSRPLPAEVISPIQSLQQAIERITLDLESIPKASMYYTEYHASIIPQDLDVFFDPTESNAAWLALESVAPGARRYYENRLKRLRRIFSEIVLDHSSN